MISMLQHSRHKRILKNILLPHKKMQTDNRIKQWNAFFSGIFLQGRINSIKTRLDEVSLKDIFRVITTSKERRNHASDFHYLIELRIFNFQASVDFVERSFISSM